MKHDGGSLSRPFAVSLALRNIVPVDAYPVRTQNLGCEAGNRRSAYVVAVGEFFQRSALRAPPDRLFLLGRCEGRGAAHVLSLGLGAAPPFGSAGAD